MIVVLNFGSQFAHLIARRVRDLGVKAEIVSFDASLAAIKALQPRGIIFSGGPASVLETKSPRPDKGIFSLGIPVLGICYGHQVMAAMLGGNCKKAGCQFQNNLPAHPVAHARRPFKQSI